MTKTLLYLLFSLALLFHAVGWALLGVWLVGLFLLLLISVSLVLLKQNIPSTLGVTLALLILSSALGLWRGLNLSLALAGLLCALAAWDLADFSRRLAFSSPEDNPLGIEHQHLMRLGLVLLVGLAINLFSFSIRLVFNFEWALALAFITFIGIGALVHRLGNNED